MLFIVNQNQCQDTYDYVSDVAALVSGKLDGQRGFGFLRLRVPDEDTDSQQLVSELLREGPQPTFVVGPDNLYLV